MISGSPLKFGSITIGVLVVLLSAGCSPSSQVSDPLETPETLTTDLSSTPTAVSPAASSSPAQPDFFQAGLEKATSATAIIRSAQSRDDWTLVANRWQQAIDLMSSVPTASANRPAAQGKIIEYRRNLEVARQRANQPAPARPDTARSGSITIVERSPTSPMMSRPNTAGPAPSTPQRRMFSAPIVRREGGTPVIRVLFNGAQPFDMIVDTGASGTLITQQMAATLNIVPVGQAQVDTASAQSVTFPLGYVRSIQVDQAIAQNVLVAVAGSGLQTGLLGHDFFGNYDVTIRQDRVEFSER